MTSIASYIETFLREYLGHQRGASPHTCDSYAYSLTDFTERTHPISTKGPT